MQKISIFLFITLLLTGCAASKGGASKAAKEASRALSSFNIGGANDPEKLKEAIDAIEEAIQDPIASQSASTWITRGQIYNAVVNLFTTQSFAATDENPAMMLDNDAPTKSFNSFEKALGLAEKSWETKDALKGMSEGIANLNNAGFTAFEAGEYQKAYDNFNKVIDIHKLLTENGEKSGLEEEGAYNDQLYTTGLAALNAGNMDDAAPIFMELEEKGFDQPAMYDALYKINKDDDVEKALSYLNKGRENHPDDVSLLFTEINHYLTAGQMDILEDRLKQAIAKEPTNQNLYYTLGRVYSDVADANREEGDEKGAKEYFDKAVEQFNNALEQKPDFYEAMYGIGEMYYNEAALVSTKMQELTMSREDQDKYKVMEEEMTMMFDKALPYFQESEKMNPNDNNTLVALSEIYARRDDFEKVTEFKNRLKTVQDGGTNESYFENN